MAHLVWINTACQVPTHWKLWNGKNSGWQVHGVEKKKKKQDERNNRTNRVREITQKNIKWRWERESKEREKRDEFYSPVRRGSCDEAPELFHSDSDWEEQRVREGFGIWFSLPLAFSFPPSLLLPCSCSLLPFPSISPPQVCFSISFTWSFYLFYTIHFQKLMLINGAF